LFRVMPAPSHDCDGDRSPRPLHERDHHGMSDNTFFWLTVAICAVVLCLPLFLRRHQARRDHRWMR
jgi:hypothetical protein